MYKRRKLSQQQPLGLSAMMGAPASGGSIAAPALFLAQQQEPPYSTEPYYPGDQGGQDTKRYSQLPGYDQHVVDCATTMLRLNDRR